MRYYLGLELSWLEQYTHNVLVPGSSPGGPTKSNKIIDKNFNFLKIFLKLQIEI